MDNSDSRILITAVMVGDNLDVIDLGTDFYISSLAQGPLSHHMCASNANMNDKWKCWG